MERNEGDEEPDIYRDRDKDETGAAPTWEITKNLLDAHTRSGQALERYVLLQYLDQEGTDEELRTTIEQAISDHERIIEDLEAALENVPAQATDRE